MQSKEKNNTDKRISPINESINNMVADSSRMPELDSETQVLKFLHEHQIPLKPIEVYGGLIHTRTINFKYRTVQNKLHDLSKAGFIDRVEIDTDAGKVRSLPKTEADRRAAYVITDDGIAELESRL